MRNLVPFLLLIIISACSNKGTDPVDSAQQMMPTSVGNSWNYVELPAPGFSGDTNSYTLSITKDTVMNLIINSVNDIGHWYRVTGLAGAAPTYYANRSGGFWQTFFYNDGTNNIVITSLMAKYPAAMGNMYSRPYPAPLQNVSQEVEVISTDSIISVPSGNFTCHVYRVTSSSDSRRLYDAFYALGVGLVKIHVYGLAPADNSITGETRLTGFNVN